MNNKCVKGFRKVFKKFASETSMHGFKDLSSSKHVSTTIFWVSVLIFAICMVGMHIAKTVKEFSEQKTTMMIQPADMNETILYPPFRICYPHWLYWVSFAKAEKLGFTKDATLYALAYLGIVYMQNNDDLSLCQAHKDFLIAMEANKFNNLSTFYLSILDGRAIWPPFISSSWRKEPSPFMYYDGLSSQLCAIADEHKLTTLFRNNQLNSESRKVVVINNLFTEVFEEYEQVVNEDEYFFYMTDWYNKDQLGPADTYSKKDTNVSMSMTFCPLGYAHSRTCFQIDSSVYKYFVFITGNVYKWKNRPHSPCLEKTSWISPNYTCSAMCPTSAGNFDRSLGCFIDPPAPVDEIDFTAFKWHNIQFYENGDMLAIEKPKNCSSEKAIDRELLSQSKMSARTRYESCIKSCWKGCVEYRYTYTIQQKPFSDNSVGKLGRISTVEIDYQQNQDILVMTEEELQTWENFVGNVGGLLGIWTGASILSFVQTLYLCCFTSVEDCCKRCHKTGTRHNLQQGIQLDAEEGQTINIRSKNEETFEVCLE